MREGEVLLVGGDPAFLSWDWALKLNQRISYFRT